MHHKNKYIYINTKEKPHSHAYLFLTIKNYCRNKLFKKPYLHAIDLYLNHRFFGYEDSYSHYDIDADKILLYKKSNNEYLIRYKDINKMKIVPLQ